MLPNQGTSPRWMEANESSISKNPEVDQSSVPQPRKGATAGLRAGYHLQTRLPTPAFTTSRTGVRHKEAVNQEKVRYQLAFLVLAAASRGL